MAINDPTPEIAAHYKRWAKNRAFLAGNDAVKAAGELYHPKPDPQMTAQAHALWLQQVTFFPAARRTAYGYLGLMFHKRPVFSASDAAQELARVITPDGDTHEDLAWKVSHEVLATDFCGLFVDHPEALPGLSKADAFRAGQRPFVSLYVAESILEVSTALIRGRKRVSRVRLLEDEGRRVRELLLEDGIYVVVVHDYDGSQWTAQPPRAPLINGKPLQDIPFHVVSSGNTITPQLGLLDDVVNLNHNHYLHQGELTSVYRFIGRPIPYVIGAQEPEGGWSVRAGTVWSIEGNKSEVEVGFNNYSGSGVDHLIDQRDHLEDQMAKVGARLLASEKSAAEAAETHAIRRASENATLASVANNISRALTDALQLVVTWAGFTEEVRYQINTDYLPMGMEPGEISVLQGLVNAGHLSWETFFLLMRDAGVLPTALEPEEERLKIDDDDARREAKMERTQAIMMAAAPPGKADE